MNPPAPAAPVPQHDEAVNFQPNVANPAASPPADLWDKYSRKNPNGTRFMPSTVLAQFLNNNGMNGYALAPQLMQQYANIEEGLLYEDGFNLILVQLFPNGLNGINGGRRRGRKSRKMKKSRKLRKTKKRKGRKSRRGRK